MEKSLEKQRELAEQIHTKTQELAVLTAEPMRQRMDVIIRIESTRHPLNIILPSLKVTESIIY